MLPIVTAQARRFVAVVDTGFTNQLWMGNLYAQRLGVTPSLGPSTQVILANGGLVTVIEGWLNIQWVHGIHRAHVFMYPARPNDTEVLVGTGLLKPSTLEIVFLSDTVEIRP
ncbi:MAG: hypothetical protein WBK28_03915 [Minisyncoccia bacterium]